MEVALNAVSTEHRIMSSIRWVQDLVDRACKHGLPGAMGLSDFEDYIRSLYPEFYAKRGIEAPSEVEDFAGQLYEAYCEAVGGKAFNGDKLPDWKTFRADPAKKKQSDAWVKVGAVAAVFSLACTYSAVAKPLRSITEAERAKGRSEHYATTAAPPVR
jgi:hypothetical protein